MAKLNYARAATYAKPSEPLTPRDNQPAGTWNDKRSVRQRQIEAWQRARACLRAAGAISDQADE